MPQRCYFELKRRTRLKNPNDEPREKMKPSNHSGILPVSQKPSIKSEGTNFRDPQRFIDHVTLMQYTRT